AVHPTAWIREVRKDGNRPHGNVRRSVPPSAGSPPRREERQAPIRTNLRVPVISRPGGFAAEETHSTAKADGGPPPGKPFPPRKHARRKAGSLSGLLRPAWRT